MGPAARAAIPALREGVTSEYLAGGVDDDDEEWAAACAEALDRVSA
jgi:hypothetical protein